MDADKLQEILESHQKWLNDQPGGKRANLSWANLSWANLSGAKLSGANLSWANLSGADLSGADLSCADLSWANLSGANLFMANLFCANLSLADLRGTDLCGVNLYGAYLTLADLRGTNLCEANLYGAELSGVKIELELFNQYFPNCCPECGSFTAWKRASGNYIVKLEVTASAKRSSAYGRKCRCSEAKVLAIENVDGSAANVTEVHSEHDENFVYRVGDTVRVNDFDEDRRHECAPGIHFFITRQEAVDYM